VTAPGETAATRIASLDGLRAIAVLCVCWGHAKNTLPPPFPEIGKLLPEGGFGVQVFFVLSGFLITRLLLGERARTGMMSLRGFYRRRAYRILPAFYVFLAVVGALWAGGTIELTPLVFGGAALFVRDYVPTGGSWWLGHTWSLAIEEQFYLLWPLFLLLVPGRWVWRLLVVGVVLSPLVRVGTWLFVPPLRSGIEIMFHTRADGLMLGCLLALAWDHPRFRAIAEKSLSRRAGWVAVAWLLVSWPATGLIGPAWMFSIGYTGDSIAVAVILTWMILRPGTLGGRVLNHRVLVHIGVVSYSLYLWQQLFLTTLNTTLLGLPGVNLVASLVAAELSYRLVELPFLRLRRHREQIRRHAADSRSTETASSTAGTGAMVPARMPVAPGGGRISAATTNPAVVAPSRRTVVDTESPREVVSPEG
jgi:peptidoglycan/LPS O-acetylase OafA/YrhL